MLTNHTKENYLKRGDSLIKRFKKQTELNPLEDLEAFLEWVLGQVLDWSPSTRRQYKAALIFWYEDKGIALNNKIWSRTFQATASKKEVQKKHGKRTSAQKMKSIKPNVWRHVRFELENSRSKVASLTLNILRASTYFGLRPIEWADSEFVLRGVSIQGIRVKNAKATQGRSFGEYRTVWLGEVTDDYYEEIFREALVSADEVLMHFKAMKQSIEGLDGQEQASTEYRLQVGLELRACRSLLGQINTRLEKKKLIKKEQRIMLYSARHQFAANAKRSGLSPIEIAALMGHGALDTNEKFYGRKASGRGGFGVCAAVDDMEAINERESAKENNDEFGLSH